MAQYDSADLLARLKVFLLRPATDERIDDPTLYQFLEEAQTYWMGVLAQHAPEHNYGPPELMTTSDGGVTYTTTAVPLSNVEVLASVRGPPLFPGPYWGPGDFTREGQIIRMCGGQARQFGGLGPYARYVATPGLLNAGTPPVLKPAHMRLLLIPRAAYIFSSQGGVLDPTYCLQAEQRLWSGDPNIAGDTGFLGALKTQDWNSGAAAVIGDPNQWYYNADFGVGR